MTHDYHEGQPGYSPAQVLCDGCQECTDRSERPWLAIDHLDPVSFLAAWRRVIQWGRAGLPDACATELPVLKVLWSLALQLERAGIPLGAFPGNAGWAAFMADARVPS